MPNQHTARVEREQLQASSAAQWQRERQGRVDAYAAALTHLNAAAAAVPMGDGSGPPMFEEIGYLAGKTRGSLRRVLDEPNPFVASADSKLREAAVAILSDAEREHLLHWATGRLVDRYSAILSSDHRMALAQMIDNIRGERA